MEVSPKFSKKTRPSALKKVSYTPKLWNSSWTNHWHPWENTSYEFPQKIADSRWSRFHNDCLLKSVNIHKVYTYTYTYICILYIYNIHTHIIMDINDDITIMPQNPWFFCSNPKNRQLLGLSWCWGAPVAAISPRTHPAGMVTAFRFIVLSYVAGKNHVGTPKITAIFDDFWIVYWCLLMFIVGFTDSSAHWSW